MCVHFDEGKATVGLEAGLGHVPEVLEQRHKVGLRGVRSEIANIACGLPLRGLLHDHVVALNTVGGEMVVPERSSRRHAHGCHGLLLGDGRLAFLVRPVAANGARTEPLAVHGAERSLGIGAVAESDETVAARPARLHVPHDARLGDGTKG